MIIRLVLDHARTVDEAVALFEDYNLSMGSGSAAALSDRGRDRQAALVEYYDG